MFPKKPNQTSKFYLKHSAVIKDLKNSYPDYHLSLLGDYNLPNSLAVRQPIKL